MKLSTKKTTQKPKRKNKRTELTDKQKEFCFNYVYRFVGDHSESYTSAGYSATSPYEISRRSKKLLEEEHIQKQIKELEEVKAGSKLVDRHYVIKELVAINEAKDTESTKDRIHCLELIGKHLKLWTDKVVEKTTEKIKDSAIAAYEMRMQKEQEEKEQTVEEESEKFLKFKEGGSNG